MIKPVAVIASEIQRGITEAREKRQEMADLSPRELDARVAVEVMQWTEPDNGRYGECWQTPSGRIVIKAKWKPSSDWSCMKLVVERMQELGWEWGMSQYKDNTWVARLDKFDAPADEAEAKADTLPRAVSLVARKAVAT